MSRGSLRRDSLRHAGQRLPVCPDQTGLRQDTVTSLLGTGVPPCGISRCNRVTNRASAGLAHCSDTRLVGPGTGPCTPLRSRACSAPSVQCQALRRPSRGRFRDVYSTVYQPFIHRLIHSVDEAVDSTRWGSIGSEHPRAHVLMYTDEHVVEDSINGPPDEASAWRDVCVVHMRRDRLLELALYSSGGGALPHGPRACTSLVTSATHVTVTVVVPRLCATFCCCVCSSSMCLA